MHFFLILIPIELEEILLEEPSLVFMLDVNMFVF